MSSGVASSRGRQKGRYCRQPHTNKEQMHQNRVRRRQLIVRWPTRARFMSTPTELLPKWGREVFGRTCDTFVGQANGGSCIAPSVTSGIAIFGSEERRPQRR